MGVVFLTPESVSLTATPGKGYGSVAIEPIAAGEVVAVFGGRCVDPRRVRGSSRPANRCRSVQIDEAPVHGRRRPEPEPAGLHQPLVRPQLPRQRQRDCSSHLATSPSAKNSATTTTVTDGSDYDEFECLCGSAALPGKVSGHDWMLPELQLRYRGSFSPYLAKRIAALAQSRPAERRAFAL